MVRKNVALLITALLVLTVPTSTVCAQKERNAVAGTTIPLVRHGETDWNALGYLQGWADTTLNPVGLSEVEELGAVWREKAGMDVDVVYSSPINPTKQTYGALLRKSYLRTKERQF